MVELIGMTKIFWALNVCGDLTCCGAGFGHLCYSTDVDESISDSVSVDLGIGNNDLVVAVQR